MLAAFWAVLIDLFYFVFPISHRFSKQVILRETPTPTTGFSMAIPEPRGVTIETGQEAYVQAPETILYTRPIVAFDTKQASIPYATRVVITATEGIFTRASIDGQTGWIHTPDLTFDRAQVYPSLTPGRVYAHDDLETIKIRRWLKDECLGGALFLALQPTEYVLYELMQKGGQQIWTEERPRTPGTWQTLLRGRRGVRISIEPKTGSVIEYNSIDHQSVIGIVEAVHPDETIVMCSVGKAQEGQYLVETLSKDTWRELRPVFISFV